MRKTYCDKCGRIVDDGEESMYYLCTVKTMDGPRNAKGEPSATETFEFDMCGECAEKAFGVDAV